MLSMTTVSLVTHGEGFYTGKAVGCATVFKQLARKNQEQVFQDKLSIAFSR